MMVKAALDRVFQSYIIVLFIFSFYVVYRILSWAYPRVKRKPLLSDELRSVFNSLTEGILILDQDGMVLDSNDAFFAMTRRSPDEILMVPDSPLRRQIVKCDGHLMTSEELPSSIALSTGRAVRNVELGWPDPDGTIRWYSVNASPARLDAHHPPRVVLSFSEITERKVIENGLRDTIRSFDRVSVLVRDRDDRIIGWTSGCERLYGFTVDQAEGRVSHNLLKTVFQEPLAKIREKVETNGRWMGELIRTRSDGKQIIVESEWVSTRDNSGRIVSVTEISFDITERKEAQRAARYIEEEFRGAFEVSSVGMMQADPKTMFPLRVNKKFCEMVGYSEEELLNMPILQYTHPDDRDANLLGLKRLFSGEVAEFRNEKRYVRKDGTEVWVDLTVNLIRDSNGNPRVTVGVVQDVTDRRRAMESFQQADRRKDEFLATLSHELRTPLTSIMSWAQLLKSGKLDAEKTRQAVQTIEASATSQSQLIEDLLDISRIRAGKLTLDLQPTDPVGTLLSSIDLVRPMADKKVIRIEETIESSGLTVNADPIRLKQVFWNLLTNAIKFTNNGGQIFVRLSEFSDQDVRKVRIEIRDTGKGIKPEFLPHLFDRFTQADSSSIRTQGGLGLGLALVRSLLEAQAGRVEAQSPGPGKGSLFIVSLPLAETSVLRGAPMQMVPQAFRTIHQRKIEPKPVLNGIKVLLVDDEEKIREVLALALREFGAEVIVASSAQEALARVAETSPSVIVSDIAMPLQNGYDFIRKVRAIEKELGASRVPAIALTAFGGHESKAKALASGFEKYLAKPVDLTELARMVAQLYHDKNSGLGKISQEPLLSQF